MKNLLLTLFNLFHWIGFITITFFEILWYGKLPKVSLYHRFKYGTVYKTKDIYENENCQVFRTIDVPKEIKAEIINRYIDILFLDGRFKKNVACIDIPLFDGKEIHGTTGVNTILQDVKQKYLNQ